MPGPPTTTHNHALISSRTGRSSQQMSFISLMTLYSFDPRRSNGLHRDDGMGAATTGFADNVLERVTHTLFRLTQTPPHPQTSPR